MTDDDLRVMIDELAKWKAACNMRYRECQAVIQSMMEDQKRTKHKLYLSIQYVLHVPDWIIGYFLRILVNYLDYLGL